MLSKEKVCDVIVQPIQVKVDKRPVKGQSLCPDLYSNIFLVAKTNTGKTTAIFSLLKECVDDETILIFFVSTAYNDANWVEIRKYFEEQGNPVLVHLSIEEIRESNNPKTGKVSKLKFDLLHDLVSQLHEEAQDEEKENENLDLKTTTDLYSKLQSVNGIKPDIVRKQEIKKKKEKKKKILAPKYVVVMDDLADEIKLPSYTNLLKYARHLKIKTITSSQYLKDLLPASRLQIRQWILFSGLPEKLLLDAYTAMSAQLEEEQFITLYKDATTPTPENPKPFFYAQPNHNDYRQNFGMKYKI